jgi:hypothetical protein
MAKPRVVRSILVIRAPPVASIRPIRQAIVTLAM